MRALFGTTLARVRVAALRVRTGCLRRRCRVALYFWCTAPHRMDTVAAAGSSPPPRASSTAQCAACRRCQSTRCVRPARGVQKSNRHARDLVCMPSCPEDVHRTVAHGRRRRASFGAWLSRRAGALGHAHLHSLGRAAGLRASVNRGIARTRRRRPSVLCMTLSAPCRATPRAALVPGAVDLAGLLVLAVSLSSLAVPPQLNDCSHGRTRVSQTGLARSATAPGALRALFRHFWSNRKDGQLDSSAPAGALTADDASCADVF